MVNRGTRLFHNETNVFFNKNRTLLVSEKIILFIDEQDRAIRALKVI